MSSNARAPWTEGCGPVPAAVRCTLRSPADQSLHGFTDGASGCQGTGSLPALFVCLWLRLSRCSAGRPRILLTQDLANQSIDLSRFPQLKPLFQLGVSVDTFRVFSEEQAASVAAEQGPGLATAHGSFETFCPSRGVSRDHTSRKCHRRGPAALGEQLLVSIGQIGVPGGAIRQRAVVQGFSWEHWLRALRELLINGPASASYVLRPRLPTVLKGVPNSKFPKWCTAVPETALVDRMAPQTMQLPDAFGEQSLPTMLVSHVQHEAVISWV